MMMLTLGCLKQSLTLSNGVLDGSHVEECLLRQVVYLSVENHVEALMVSSIETITPGMPVNCSATANGCERKR